MTTMSPTVRAHLIVIDSSVCNRGVPASWNIGLGAVLAHNYDHLVLVSESMRFGKAGGDDFTAQLEGPWTGSAWGWHLVAFQRETMRRTGAFDENYGLGYLEDIDYLTRLHLAGYPSPGENDRPHRVVSHVDAWHTRAEHSIKTGLGRPNLVANRAYYERKWGCEPPGHRYLKPFGNPDRNWMWWPTSKTRP